jgi:hypothetical protein
MSQQSSIPPVCSGFLLPLRKPQALEQQLLRAREATHVVHDELGGGALDRPYLVARLSEKSQQLAHQPAKIVMTTAVAVKGNWQNGRPVRALTRIVSARPRSPECQAQPASARVNVSVTSGAVVRFNVSLRPTLTPTAPHLETGREWRTSAPTRVFRVRFVCDRHA